MLTTATTNATTDPPWKAEILHKRNEKTKADSIPAWKVELMKRLKVKAQAAELKMSADAKKNEDKPVLDEPILKVSENIFVRKEQERKMSAGQLSTKKYDVAGRHVIKKENIIIIEKTDLIDPNAAQPSEISKELPRLGIVSRLKNRFSKSSSAAQPLTYRSKSSDDILKIDYTDDRSSLTPTHASKPTSQYRQYKKIASVDSAAPHLLKASYSSENIISSLKTSPALSNKATVPSREENVNLNTLHASVSTERPSQIKKNNEQSDVIRERPKFTDRTQEFTKGTVTLHASSCDKKTKNKEDVFLVPETITLTSPTFPTIGFGDRSKLDDLDKKKNENITKVDDVILDGSPVKEKPPQSNSSNKENIPEVPKRRSTSITTSRSSPTKKNAPTSDSPQIIELGKISMDPSQLKSKAAHAANEIMKESRTIMIVPRGQKHNSLNQPDAKIVQSETKSSQNKPNISVASPARTEPSKVEFNSTDVKEPGLITNLPTSSIDEVISEATPSDKADKPVIEVAQTKPTYKNSSLKPAGGRNFTIGSSNKKVVSQRSVETNAAVNDMFGTKLSSTRSPSKSPFTGKGTFVIDPSRFKKSSSAQNSTSSVQSAGASKPVTANSGTRVIVPKSQIETSSVPTPTVEEDGAATKGKRKLTVDQIVVVGGYVKLDHSSLSKPNKIRKGNRVKFEENQLESVYQYPSESSLLKEDHEKQLNQKMSSLGSNPGSGKDSQLGKYTPKYLLAMSQQQLDNDNDDNEKLSSSSDVKKEAADIAVPLRDEEAISFSVSSSDDLLF